MLLLLGTQGQRLEFREFIKISVKLYDLNIKDECIDQIMSDFSELDHTSEMYHAQADIVRLIHLMVNEAKRRDSSEISIEIWEKVKSWFCPLPPWIEEPC